MKKYLKYVVFSMVMFLTLCFSVSALDCYYTRENSDGTTLDAHFRINENNNKIVFSSVAGMLEDEEDETNKRNISNNLGQKIENWDKVFNPFTEIGTQIDFKGVDHYKKNNTCPQYVVVVDRIGQLDLIVAEDKDNILTKVKNYGEKKQRYAVLNNYKLSGQEVIRYPSSCLGLNQASCKNNENFSCVWVDNKDYDFLDKGYCNVDNLLYVSCGGANDIPVQVPSLISMLVNLLKIATPIILIIISMITLVKALAAGKEDEIKKATSSLIKKMIAAALVFFVVAIVQFVISKVAEDDVYEGFDDCLNCFLNNSCSENMYYKTVISGQDWCTDISDGDFELCNPDE